MMYLFFDTETTGLPRKWRAPVTDFANWPRMVQVAWVLTEEDGKEVGSGSHIIRPSGFLIPEDASRVHRITTQRALEEGEELVSVLSRFAADLARAEVLVAHNLSFDEMIVGAEFLRMDMPNHLDGKERLCTMESSTTYCNIPGQYGPKWPRLSELHEKLFGETFSEAHNAENDIRATVRCFFELRHRGVI
jgi:DNA polymerase III subunit epsilon